MREKWREGRVKDVGEWLAQLKVDPEQWEVLSDEVRANLLRFEANFELDERKNIARAKQLVDEAHSISDTDRESEARLRAVIAAAEGEFDEAFKFSEGVTERGSINVRAGLHLEQGDIDGCLFLLDDISDGNIPELRAETHRLRSLAFLGLGSKQVIKPAGLGLDESCSSSRHGIHVAPGGLGPFSRH